MNKTSYTGLNKRLRSNNLQILLNKKQDGTIREFIDDWKWIFGFSKKYRRIVVLYTVFGILSSTLSLGAAWVSKILINIIVGREVDKVWLLRDAPVLLLDEATSALDVETEERVLKNIIQAQPNRVIIVSTHRPSVLKLCSRIYRITDGGMQETDLDCAKELFWRYADLPAQGKGRPGRAPRIKPEDMPLSPKDKEDMISEKTNEGWWNE